MDGAGEEHQQDAPRRYACTSRQGGCVLRDCHLENSSSTRATVEDCREAECSQGARREG